MFSQTKAHTYKSVGVYSMVSGATDKEIVALLHKELLIMTNQVIFIMENKRWSDKSPTLSKMVAILNSLIEVMDVDVPVGASSVDVYIYCLTEIMDVMKHNEGWEIKLNNVKSALQPLSDAWEQVAKK